MSKKGLTLLAFLLTACSAPEDEPKTGFTIDPGAQGKVTSTGSNIDIAQVEHVIRQRCASCHSAEPTDEVFRAAPGNVAFDTLEQMQRHAPRIRARAVDTQTMPFMNKTGMTEEERRLVGDWIKAGAPGN